MQERDLIVAVLAAQAGFVAPSEVLAAAAAGLVDLAPDSLLTRLEKSGALDTERRKALEALVDQALAARNGDARAVLTSMGAAASAIETLVSSVPGLIRGSDGQPDADVAVPLERPGQYTRLGELGRGSQSVVRVARDEIVGREVALKELVATALPANDDSSRAAQTRFLREVRLVAGLDHPGIVAIHDLARREDGTLFCAQKLVRGENLQSKIATCRSLADRLGLLRHVLDACQAMGFAHSKHIIHRDLKPSNVMVGEYGETVVVDWGLAKRQEEPEEVVPLAAASAEPSLTIAGAALGTPSYMSPEQARGDLPAINTRSDVFSLGAILYQVLTGHPPFEGVNADHILENVRAGKFPPVLTMSPGAPPELAAIAERALRPEPSKRYQGASELARELSAYLAGGRVRAYQYGAWELLRKFVAANRRLSLMAAVALLILAALVANVVRQLQTTRLNLANSFLERARAAESVSDWGRAAGYYTASRVEHDSREAQWGAALARQRIVPRVLARQGRPDGYVGAGFDETGRIWVLSRETGAIVARMLADGRELWRIQEEDPSEQVVLLGGAVQLRSRTAVRYLDPATGRVVASFERASGIPCPFGPLAARVLRPDTTGVWQLGGTATSRPLASTRFDLGVCAVSDDASRFALLDDSGAVRVWNTSTGEEVDSRPAADASHLFFTPHGLAIVRARSVQVFGGPDGDFSVDVPARSGSGRVLPLALKANARSPDGHRLAIAGLKTGQADIVDLRERRVLASLNYPYGPPEFEFSPDGEQLIVSRLVNASVLIGWDLRPRSQEHPVHGSQFMTLRVSSNAHRFMLFHFDRGTSRYEVFDDRGTGLLEDRVNGAWNVALSGDGKRIAVSDRNGVELREIDGGRRLQRFPCVDCRRLALSADGSRLLTANLKGLNLWEASSGQAIWRETTRFGSLSEALQLSPDGRMVAWALRSTLFIHDQASGGDRELHLDGPPGEPGFSQSGDRLAVATDGVLAVYSLEDLRPIWQVAKNSWVPTGAKWSSDDSVVILFYESLGTVLFDATTGQRIATIAPAKPGGIMTQENVLPDLKHRISRVKDTWELSALPQPDTEKPSESLASILHEAGLQLKGAELVDELTATPTMNRASGAGPRP